MNIEKDGNPVCHISERAADCSVLEFSLEDPILWWPRPYGEPFLYDFVLRLERRGRSFRKYAKNSEYAGLLFYRNLWRTAFPFNSR